MTAIEFLKQKNLKDRIINNEDLPEYWVAISEIMEQYCEFKTEEILKLINKYEGKIKERELLIKKEKRNSIKSILQNLKIENELIIIDLQCIIKNK